MYDSQNENYNDFYKSDFNETSNEKIKDITIQIRLGFIRKVYGILSVQLNIIIIYRNDFKFFSKIFIKSYWFNLFIFSISSNNFFYYSMFSLFSKNLSPKLHNFIFIYII